jgi:hypothetical protein
MGSKILEYHLPHIVNTTCIDNLVESRGLEQQLKKKVHQLALETKEMTEMILPTLYILLLGIWYVLEFQQRTWELMLSVTSISRKHKEQSQL